MFDGEALVWPGVEDAWFGEPVVGELPDPRPGHSVLLATPPKRAPPMVDDVVTKGRECPAMGRHCVVLEEAGDHLLEPFRLFADWPVHSPPQFLLDLLSFARTRSRRLFLWIRNLPLRDLPLIKVKPRKSTVSGLPSPRCSRLAAAWRPNSIRRVLSGWRPLAIAALEDKIVQGATVMVLMPSMRRTSSGSRTGSGPDADRMMRCTPW